MKRHVFVLVALMLVATACASSTSTSTTNPTTTTTTTIAASTTTVAGPTTTEPATTAPTTTAGAGVWTIQDAEDAVIAAFQADWGTTESQALEAIFVCNAPLEIGGEGRFLRFWTGGPIVTVEVVAAADAAAADAGAASGFGEAAGTCGPYDSGGFVGEMSADAGSVAGFVGILITDVGTEGESGVRSSAGLVTSRGNLVLAVTVYSKGVTGGDIEDPMPILESVLGLIEGALSS